MSRKFRIKESYKAHYQVHRQDHSPPPDWAGKEFDGEQLSTTGRSVWFQAGDRHCPDCGSVIEMNGGKSVVCTNCGSTTGWARKYCIPMAEIEWLDGGPIFDASYQGKIETTDWNKLQAGDYVFDQADQAWQVVKPYNPEYCGVTWNSRSGFHVKQLNEFHVMKVLYHEDLKGWMSQEAYTHAHSPVVQEIKKRYEEHAARLVDANSKYQALADQKVKAAELSKKAYKAGFEQQREKAAKAEKDLASLKTFKINYGTESVTIAVGLGGPMTLDQYFRDHGYYLGHGGCEVTWRTRGVVVSGKLKPAGGEVYTASPVSMGDRILASTSHSHSFPTSQVGLRPNEVAVDRSVLQSHRDALVNAARGMEIRQKTINDMVVLRKRDKVRIAELELLLDQATQPISETALGLKCQTAVESFKWSAAQTMIRWLSAAAMVGSVVYALV